jgi:threonine/homoserine/homoserine lactone efflux protein
MVDVALILPATGLGLAYAATPGVVNTECLRRGVAHGFRQAFSVQLGALVGDGLWAVLALGGVAALAQGKSIGIALGAIGSIFLCRLAFGALRSAWIGQRPTAARAARGGAVWTGVVFGLANPAGLAFWAGIGGGTLAVREVNVTVYGLFLVAFLVGALCWSFGFSALVAWGRRFASPRLFRAIDAVCGAVLGFFGVRLLWTTVRRIRV